MEKRAKIDKELQSVEEMRKALEDKMKALKDLQKQLEEGSGADAPSSSTPASSQNRGSGAGPPDGLASSVAEKALSPPPAPPAPTPIKGLSDSETKGGHKTA